MGIGNKSIIDENSNDININNDEQIKKQEILSWYSQQRQQSDYFTVICDIEYPILPLPYEPIVTVLHVPHEKGSINLPALAYQLGDHYKLQLLYNVKGDYCKRTRRYLSAEASNVSKLI